ncbi:MAG: PrsW family glutamic-type intramembrane protease [Planctomycetota bacterium]|jgi:RsiW-degrading membrane proteinase PrsW (M82 family)
MKKKEYFSVDHEPALAGGQPESDPAEERAGPTESLPTEVEALRDSIADEPALAEHRDPEQWSRWLQQKRAECTLPGNLGVTLLAALLGGPFAIVGAFMQGQTGLIIIIYAVLFGPVVEELLKQSGMTFVLEKKPYRVFAAWQFVFAAVVSGLVFGAIENLVYVHVYFAAADVPPEKLPELAAIRWSVCMPLHAIWAAVASLGLVRAWKRQLRDGRPADLSAAFPWFVTAIALHGLYNLSALWIGPKV